MRCQADYGQVPPVRVVPLVWVAGLLMVGLMLLAAAGCTTSTGAAAGAHRKKAPGELVARSVLRSTVGAALKAPVESAKMGHAVTQDRLRTLVVGNSPLSHEIRHGQGGYAEGAGAGGEPYEALLDREGMPARTAGKVDFFVDGSRFFPLYLQALKGARSSIDVQTFIFDNDDFGVQVADVLRAKSHQVPVRVLFDGLGSAQAAEVTAKSQPKGFTPPENILAYLRSGAGDLEARRTGNAFFLADHSKLHIIDGDVAFAGGMNLGREYRYEWHDLMAKVQGPIVADLQTLYERRWRSDAWWRKLQRRPARGPAAGVGVGAAVAQGDGAEGSSAASAPGTGTGAPPPAARDLLPLRLLITDARRGRRDIFKATLLGIRSAKRRIWIETPYFSNDELTGALEAALKRGVQVRVVVPAEVDQKLMQANNAADLAKLMKLGAQVYAYPGMTHLKATVCDDWGMFGSANYDTLSQRINIEMNLASSDPRLVRALVSRVFEQDFRTAHRMTPAEVKAQAGAMAEFVGDQL